MKRDDVILIVILAMLIWVGVRSRGQVTARIGGASITPGVDVETLDEIPDWQE